ncbi:MAG: ATP-binding cassette domain-containing protein, partial [Gammaproteobacteria bacterium]|nr:ATP-binding cassette domain-containing protein [Gammaproteobacteria bacterium]
AVLAAYKDLASPWKELLSYYQLMADSQIKYDQLIEQFQPADMLTDEQQQPMDDASLPLEGPIIATNVTLEEDGGIKVVEGATFSVDSRAAMALVGLSGGGRSGLAQVIARLLRPTGGLIKIGGHNLATLSEAITGRRLAYVGPNAHLFSASVRDNLYYGLKHRVLREREYEGEDLAKREWFVTEAEAAGNTTSDPDADWIDLEAAGVADTAALADRAIETLTAVDLQQDIYSLGLQGTIDPAAKPDLAARILEARDLLHRRLDETGAGDLVEAFDVERYNTNMSVAENLVFGAPIDEAFRAERLHQNTLVREVLDDFGLTENFVDIGRQVAGLMLDLFADVAPGSDLFEQFSFIGADDLPEFRTLLTRTSGLSVGQMEPADQASLMALPFKLVVARHRLGLIDDSFQARILEARQVLARRLLATPGKVEPFDVERVNPAVNIQDNILFGRLGYGRARGAAEIGSLLTEVVDQLDLRRGLIDAGLNYHVGVGGARLSTSQRQRLAIARAVLKQPDILVLDEATAALDESMQRRVRDNLFANAGRTTLFWVVHRPTMADAFDYCVVIEDGRVTEVGRFEQLHANDGPLAQMLAAS